MLTSITTTGTTNLPNSYWPNQYWPQKDSTCPGCGRPKKCPCCGEPMPMDLAPIWRYPIYPQVIC